ncbi:hypothetical protein ABEY43_06325 [Priestia megaterium]
MDEMSLLEILVRSEFGTYVMVATLVFAIREATKVPKKYIPALSIVIGVLLAILEFKGFSFEVLKSGIQNAVWAIAMVFGVKYVQDKKSNKNT